MKPLGRAVSVAPKKKKKKKKVLMSINKRSKA